MERATEHAHKLKRMTVEIDLTELARAKRMLGTRTTSDTINGALRQVNRHVRLARSAALIASGDLDAISPKELAALRRVKG